MMKRLFSCGLLVSLSVVVSACSMMPGSGPLTRTIEDSATTSNTQGDAVALQYALVDVSKGILPFLTDPGAGSLYSSFRGGRGPAIELKAGTGDVLQVTLFESASGGLFIPNDAGSRPGNYVTLPQQTVDRTGYISVPYAGEIMAGGKTLSEIGHDIEHKLANRAIEPQAVVTLVNQTSQQVTVIGEVGTPGKISLNPAGERVLDVISRAGGIRWNGYEVYVTLERNRRNATVWFDSIVHNPQENIYMMPGDTLYIYRQQRAFTAFGASGSSGQYKFDAEQLTLADGVSKAGGLLDAQADARQVFLYRQEPREVLEKAGVDLTKFPIDKRMIPTIYRTSFRDPSGFFLSQQFLLRDKDVIYVSNADKVEIEKFISLLNAATVQTLDTNLARQSFKY